MVTVTQKFDAIEVLVAELSKLPGIGQKTARRFAFYILNAPESYAVDLANALTTVRSKTGLCSQCCNITEADPCRICSAGHRTPSVICIVERPTDVIAFENTGEFSGHYHVLHGLINPLEGVGPDDLKFRELLESVQQKNVEEAIVATNPSVNGEATAAYIQRLLSPLGIMVSRIAQGISIGSDIEFTDKLTLSRALSGRRPL